jgi:molybdenum-dependent DNA-binding transcriptional regulator ModE
VDRLNGAGKGYQKPKRLTLDACAAVERLVIERKAGREVGSADLDPLEFELLCAWEAREREHELLFRSDFADFVAALKARSASQ